MIMSWNEAENFCASKGGHLASVTSSFHQRRIKAFMEKKGIQSPSNIWLGGTDYEVEGEWTWSDGSKWGYTYWRSNEPTNASDENCLLSNRWKNWRWYDEPCDAKYPFICNVGTKMTLSSDTQLVFTSENISIPAIKFRWVSEPIRQTENENGELAVVERDLTRKTTAMTTNKTIGGLKLSWQLLGSVNQTKSDDIMSDVWKIKNHDTPYEKDMNMMTIMNLVQESKIYGVSQGEVWKALLKHRWDIGILGTSPCLNENQIAEVIVKTGPDLNLKYDWNIWIHEEDLAFGTQLYTTLCQCPGKLVEAAKLSAFFDSLLTSQNLNTVVAATMHNIQPRAGENIKDFTAINMWYKRLDERYNFSLGSNVLPLLTTDNLTTLAGLNPPYLSDYNANSDGHQYNNMSSLYGEISQCESYFIVYSCLHIVQMF